MKPHRPLLAVLLAATLALPAAASAAEPGSLDASFDGDGVAATPVPPGGYGFREVGRASDGRIVAAGQVLDGSHQGVVVVRYLPDGRLDDAFGTGGMVRLQLGEGPYPSSQVSGLAVDADGGAVVVGWASEPDRNEAVAAARIEPSGRVRWQVRHQIGRTSPTPTPDGAAIRGSRGEAVLALPGGKLLIGGTATTDTRDGRESALARLNPEDGSLDRAFADQGVLIESGHGPGDASIRTLVPRPSGGFVAGGGVYEGCGYRQTCPRALLQAYGPDGTRDASFATGTTGLTEVAELALAPGDTLVAVGTVHREFTNIELPAIARYTASGALDPSFAAPDGFMRLPERLAGAGGTVAVQGDGRILVGARAADDRWAVGRLLPDGRVDESFGFAGLAATAPTGRPTVVPGALLLQPDGRIVVAGSLDAGDDSNRSIADQPFAVARLVTGTAHGRLGLDRNARVRGRQARVTLSCTALGATACAGRLALTSLRGRRVTFGRAGYAIPSGEGATIRIELSRTARRAMRRAGGRMTARLVVANQGDRTIRRRVTLSTRGSLR